MEFVGIRVIKADLDQFNESLGSKVFHLKDVDMFRDGKWAACIECPLMVHSIEFMRIMDRLREFCRHYFISATSKHIVIFIQ